MIDISKIRNDFKILNRKVYDKPLVYFDNAATTQKPECVINALVDYYHELNSNIHRGVHYLSSAGTTAFEEARECVRQFLNAGYSHEIIFTKGTTESINLVASSFAKRFLSEGDEIILSAMEHHSNIVPWQMVCEEKGANIKVIPVTEKGELDMTVFEDLLSPKTKLVSIAHVSNVLGTINPVEEIIAKAHKAGAYVLLDGAQAIAHTKVDVQELGCDFYCFSGHKMYAPMGTGVLYGKENILNELPPYQGGGEMIKEVSFQKTTYNDLPFKFEAGTPSVADILGLRTAIQYIQEIGIPDIQSYEEELLQYANNKLKDIDDIRLIGTSNQKAAVVSFLLKDTHPSDVGILLDHFGIAVRTGHHCAEPIMECFRIPGTARASFAVYNTKEEIDFFIESLQKVKKMLL